MTRRGMLEGGRAIGHTMRVLKTSTLLLSLYATYSAGWAINDLLQERQIELWASGGMIGFGLLLLLAAVLIRAMVPGGLAFAAAALLGLQALDVHNASHLGAGIPAQIARGMLALLLFAMAFYGTLPSRASRAKGPTSPPSPSPPKQTR